MDLAIASTGAPRRRARTLTTALAGAVLGAALALVFLRPSPVVGMLGPAPAARVVDAKGRPVAAAAGAPLLQGHRVKAGGAPVSLTLTRGVEIVVQPQGELTVQTAGARIEQGGAVIDATAVIEEVRLDTPAGAVVMTQAKVEIRATAGGAGASSAVALVQALQGTVRLEAAGQTVPVEAGGGGLMVAGRPPRRTDPGAGVAAPVALASAVAEGSEGSEGSEASRDSDDESDRGSEEDRRAPRRPRDVAFLPVLLPVPVAVPAAVLPGAAERGGAGSGAPLPGAVERGGASSTPGLTGALHAIVELTGVRPEASPPRAPDCAPAPLPFAGKNGRLAGAFVQVTSERPRPPRAAPPVSVVHRACDFSPPLIALALGGTIELRTALAVARPVRVTADAEVLRDLAPMPDRPASFTPASEGVFELGSDLGAKAWVVVSTHPAFAVTNEAGEARIGGLAPGRHSVRVWHPRAGERTAHMDVVPGHAAEVRVAFASPEGRAAEGAAAGAPAAEAPTAPAAEGPTAPAAEAPTAPAAESPRPPASPVASVGAGTGGARPRPPAGPFRRDETTCRLAVTAALPVAAVCAEGGFGGAKRFMKSIVMIARANGIPMACDSCHTGHDQDDAASLALKPLARERLAELLATLQQTAALSAYLREQAARASRPKR